MSETYRLPAALAMALSTNRPELVETFTGTLGPDEQREVLRLVADMIRDREESRSREYELRKRVAQSLQNIQGAVDALEDVAGGVKP